MENLREINFRYSLDLNYRLVTSCAESGCEEGICRCGTIDSYDVDINGVNLNYMAETIFTNLFLQKQVDRQNLINGLLNEENPTDETEIMIYCISRVLKSLKIYERDCWYINVVGGYYGQEIGDCVLDLGTNVFNSLYEHIYTLFGLDTLKERMEYILKLEYGYISPVLKNKNYKIGHFNDYTKLKFSNTNHYDNCKTTTKYYNDYEKSILGICTESPSTGDLNVVDGYHRLSPIHFYKGNVYSIPYKYSRKKRTDFNYKIIIAF